MDMALSNGLMATNSKVTGKIISSMVMENSNGQTGKNIKEIISRDKKMVKENCTGHQENLTRASG